MLAGLIANQRRVQRGRDECLLADWCGSVPVTTSVLRADFRPVNTGEGGPHFTGIVTFEPQADGRSTRYVARAMHADAASQQAHAAMGFHEGWNAALDQLVELASTL